MPKLDATIPVSGRELIWHAAIVQTNRIKMTIVHLQISLIFEINDSICIGRKVDPNDDKTIDLGPYGAYEMGVSRQHLVIQWVDHHVVVTAGPSRNLSFLNNELMVQATAYPLYRGDQITLGGIQLEFEFLDESLF